MELYHSHHTDLQDAKNRGYAPTSSRLYVELYHRVSEDHYRIYFGRWYFRGHFAVASSARGYNLTFDEYLHFRRLLRKETRISNDIDKSMTIEQFERVRGNDA